MSQTPLLSVKELIARAAEYLEKKQVLAPRRQAEELLSDVLCCKRLDLYLDFERPLVEGELIEFRARVKRRAEREPIDYIRGELEFFDCSIQVNRSVLIPRQETELLVDLAWQRLKSKPLEGKRLLDLCTGSGCIAIALKSKFPALAVTATDLSLEALEVAKGNAKRNGVSIDFRQGDLFSPLVGEKFDFLLSNPPYIKASDYSELEPEVRCFEPKSALIGGEFGPLLFAGVLALICAKLIKFSALE
ncbi:MAG: ywkE [Chlamydiales bacterium]|nr:ywkE [Chlamydiales bacterium]